MHPGDLQREVIAMIPRLRRLARTLAANVSDADDLVQETCVRAIAGSASFQTGARLDTWLFTILRNHWASEMRRAATRHGTGTVDAAEANDLQHSDDGAALLAAGAVRDAVLGLPEGLSSVMLLVAVEGYSYREAASILDIPVGTVMSRMSRARQVLAARLGSVHPGGRP
jgi:RNA polymerase sigma-70 factor, ECF subfamily